MFTKQDDSTVYRPRNPLADASPGYELIDEDPSRPASELETINESHRQNLRRILYRLSSRLSQRAADAALIGEFVGKIDDANASHNFFRLGSKVPF